MDEETNLLERSEGNLENWIERTAQPTKLYLAWQAPDHLRDRFRWAVGELSPSGLDLCLRYIEDASEFAAVNQGRSFDHLKRLGYQGYPGFPPRRGEIYTNVQATMLRRLPPSSRADFAEYKRQFRVPDFIRLTPIELLALTEAKLPSDGFSVVDPLDPYARPRDLMLEVAGYRYYASTAPAPIPGSEVDIMLEPENTYDPQAVKVVVEGRKIGNINRLQAAAFRSWIANGSVSASIERLNGKPNKPRAFIFVRVR